MIETITTRKIEGGRKWQRQKNQDHKIVTRKK